MKTATFPSLRVDEDLRAAAESVLEKGETLSGFVLDSIHRNIDRRKAERAFLERGLAARDQSRANDDYVSTEDMLARLGSMLTRARKRTDAA